MVHRGGRPRLDSDSDCSYSEWSHCNKRGNPRRETNCRAICKQEYVRIDHAIDEQVNGENRAILSRVFSKQLAGVWIIHSTT